MPSGWTFSKSYLLGYNVVLFFGWFYVLVKEVSCLACCEFEIYKEISVPLKIFQTAAILEIVHSAVGLVRSPIITTIIQVFSRLVILWGVIHAVDDAKDSFGLIFCTLAWSISEIIRYSFYALTLIDSLPYFLLWLRYTLFIGLYPMGVFGELLTVYDSLPEVHRKKIFTIELPNAANLSFSYYLVLCLMALLYIPLFPQLYFYMFGQRKKYLGKPTKID